MAEIKAYYNSTGPFLYDDTDLINDGDNDFSGQPYHAMVTDGQCIVEGEPTDPNHLVRKINLDELEAKLESETFFFTRIY